MKLRKLCSLVLLMVSGCAVVICGANIIPYAIEEAQSARSYSDLAAFFSGDEDELDDVVLDSEDLPAPDSGLNSLESEAAGTGSEAPDTDGIDITAAEEASEESLDADQETGTEADTGDEADVEEQGAAPTGSGVGNAGLLKLHEKNSDCVAWITIEGTAINYPVMYKPSSKNYYLHRNFYKKKSAAGALYISEICDPDTSDNVIIYGHHMNSGSMFAALNKYKKQSFYENHRYITLETLHGTETYEIIFALTTPVYTKSDFKYYAFANARNAREFEEYVAKCKARALYSTGKTASYGDRLLTLSTCEYSQRNGRMLIVAKRISGGEE